MDTLLDAGPLIALIAGDQDGHARCRATLQELSGDLFTTWPVISETMFVLASLRNGQAMQRECWRLIHDEAFMIMDIDGESRVRAAGLMEKYADVPMSLADATLTAAAEQLNTRRVFTLDSDFRIYKFRDRHHFDVIPN